MARSSGWNIGLFEICIGIWLMNSFFGIFDDEDKEKAVKIAKSAVEQGLNEADKALNPVDVAEAVEKDLTVTVETNNPEPAVVKPIITHVEPVLSFAEVVDLNTCEKYGRFYECVDGERKWECFYNNGNTITCERL